MKNLLVNTIIIVLFFLLSCKNDNSATNCRAIIDLDEKYPSYIINDSSIIGKIRLETSKESILGEINKIVEHDSQYYILDDRNVKISIFDAITGSYKKSLMKIGKGKGEYINIVDFNIKDKLLYVLAFGGQVLVYDVKSLDFIRSFKISKSYVPINIAISEDEIYYLNYPLKENNTCLFSSDKYGNHIKSITKYEYSIDEFFTFRGNQNLYIKDDLAIYNFNFDDRIFKGSDLEVELDFEKYNLPNADRISELEKLVNNGNNFGFIQTFFICNNKYVIDVSLTNVGQSWVIIDSKDCSEPKKSYSSFEISNALRSFYPISSWSDGLLFVIKPEDVARLKNIKPNKYFSVQRVNQIKEFLNSLNCDIDMNPTVLKVKV